MNNANEAAAQRTQTLNLPPHVQSTDDAVHAFAARLLRLQYIRSVTVDEHRAAALVRFTTARSTSELGEVAACCSAEPVDSPVDATSTASPIVAWFDPRDRSVSFVRMPPRARGWRKGLYLLLSGAFLLLGLIGIVLPGLPTTPFVLLGSYFLLRSSERLHQRLVGSRLFGGILRDWHIHRGLRPHVRARAIAVVAAVVVISLVVTQPPLLAVLIILALVACGLFVIWRLPTVEVE